MNNNRKKRKPYSLRGVVKQNRFLYESLQMSNAENKRLREALVKIFKRKEGKVVDVDIKELIERF